MYILLTEVPNDLIILFHRNLLIILAGIAIKSQLSFTFCARAKGEKSIHNQKSLMWKVYISSVDIGTALLKIAFYRSQ